MIDITETNGGPQAVELSASPVLPDTLPYPAPPRDASRPCTITVAPCAASCTALASPIPDVAPVTTAVFPCRESDMEPL